MTQTTSQVEAAVQRLDDLLDAYRDETSCQTYNGWFRHRDPAGIRKDIDREIAALASQQEVSCAHLFCYFGDQKIRRCINCNVQEVAEPVVDEDDAALSLSHHIRYCDRNIEAWREMGDAEQVAWWENWKTEVQRREAAARVPVASPAEKYQTVVIEDEEMVEYDSPLREGKFALVPLSHLPLTPPVGAGGAGVMDARPDSVHSDSGECDRAQGRDAKDVRFLHWTTDVGYVEIWLSKKDHLGFVQPISGPWRCPADFAAAILEKGGDQGEGK